MAFDLNKKRMRMQSTHSMETRGLDAYFSPFEAVWPLIDLEAEFIPKSIWEPCAGNGRIVRPFLQSGYDVLASDLAGYHVRDLDIQIGVDYLLAKKPKHVRGIVTNPPYKLAAEFIAKAIQEVPYSAWLLRLNFLEAERRMGFFKENPPARVLIPSQRLPMMHRLDYDGPKATSNTCHAWFIWDEDTPENQKRKFDWFDWRDHWRDVDIGY